MLQKLEYWTEWKEKCALALCADEAQGALRDFIRSRFYGFASRFVRTTSNVNPGALTPDSAEAWHWFETGLRLRNTRSGKSYKEWLFVPPADIPALDGVLRGATVLLRDVVRNWLRYEVAGRDAVSLPAASDASVGEPVPSLYELLPSGLDTAGEVECRDINSIAAGEAAAFLATLGHREKVALLARELGLSLAHPAVVSAAGCRKSVLFTAWRGALAGLASHVRSRYPREDQSTLASLTVGAYEHTRKLIFPWGKSESACAQLLMIVEHEPDTAQ